MDWHDLNGRGFWGDFWTVAITHHQVTSTQNQKSNHFLMWTGSTNSDLWSHPESLLFIASLTRTAISTPKLHLNYPHYLNISTTIRTVYSESRDEGLVERKRKLSHSDNSYNITARARPLIAWKRLWWNQTGNYFSLYLVFSYFVQRGHAIYGCFFPPLSLWKHTHRITFYAPTGMLSKAQSQFFNHSTFLAVIKNTCPLIKLMRNC